MKCPFCHEIDNRVIDSRALRLPPDRLGKVAIVWKARDDVPVEMRYIVAQGREIDLARARQGTQNLFHRPNHIHQVVSVDDGEHVCRDLPK